MNRVESIVPDTSVLIYRYLSQEIENNNILPNKIIIPIAVISELQNQANKGLKKGWDGLKEIEKLIELSKKYNFEIIYYGERPKLEDIKLAKSGSIDFIIIQIAKQTNSLLLTMDRVLYEVALSYNVNSILIKDEKQLELSFEKYLTEDTMSLHIIENENIRRKRGKPGNWYLEVLDERIDSDEIEKIIDNILYAARNRYDGFIEIERKYSYIVQIGPYRIVILRKPLSSRDEITIVRQIKKLTINDFNVDDKLLKRLDEKAEGIIIVGRPGSGKSTFAQALAQYYSSKNKIVKTIESPRDMSVTNEINQYSKTFADSEELHDILLLSRPDYVIFDEIRDTNDFKLFIDLRLAGIGMVGVSHAEKPIDIIHRLLSRTELGIIPQVIDTIIYMKNGIIDKVYYLEMKVKIPYGLTDLELARPVVEVKDFYTDELEYEIYSFGEEIVVIPIKKVRSKGGIFQLVEDLLYERFKDYNLIVNVDEDSITIYISNKDKKILLKREKDYLKRLMDKYNIKIVFKNIEKLQYAELPFDFEIGKNDIIIKIGKVFKNKKVEIIINNEIIGEFVINKKGKIIIDRNSDIGKILEENLYFNNVRIRLK